MIDPHYFEEEYGEFFLRNLIESIENSSLALASKIFDPLQSR